MRRAIGAIICTAAVLVGVLGARPAEADSAKCRVVTPVGPDVSCPESIELEPPTVQPPPLPWVYIEQRQSCFALSVACWYVPYPRVSW